MERRTAVMALGASRRKRDERRSAAALSLSLLEPATVTWMVIIPTSRLCRRSGGGRPRRKVPEPNPL